MVIHTNDPSVLALFEVDVSAGEGGMPGAHGKPGQGGNPGQPGNGAPGGTYHEQRGELSVSKQARAGHKGKQGKKGKNGRPAPTKQSKTGNTGNPGGVSFCLYNETGMTESGGTPFRVLFNKKDLPKLFPVAINFGEHSKSAQDVVLYGQKLQYGPVLPINVGSVSSPPSELLAFLVMHGQHVVSTLASAPFPRIPAENKTRYGELPANASQTVTLNVPKLRETGFRLDAEHWPLPQQWSPPTQITANFRTLLKVDGIMQKFCSADGDNVSAKEYDVTVDIPCQIVPDATGTGLMAPRSLLAIKNTSFAVQFAVKNRLAFATMDPKMCGIALQAAGSGFLPKVERPDPADASTMVMTSLTNSPGFLRTRARGPAPAVKAGQVQPVSFQLTLPEADKTSVLEPGGCLQLRAELFYDDELVQHTPMRAIRLCAPWPPEQPPSAMDLLVFTDETFAVEDYKMLRAVAVTLSLNAVFLDYQHFAEMNGGKLPTNVWSPHLGKAIVLWMPSLPGLAPLVPAEDFLEHVRAGGTLLCGGHSSFALSAGSEKLPAQAFRRSVRIGPNMTMADIRKGLQIDGQKLAGHGLVSLVMAIFATFSTERKLQYLMDKGESLGKVVLGDLQADDYQSAIPQGGGCCGCGGSSAASTVVPVRKSPVTIRDALINALRTDVMVDRCVFQTEQNTKHLIAVEQMVHFANKTLLPGPRSLPAALVARDMCAVWYACDLLNEKAYTGGTRVLWAGYVLPLRVIIARFESLAAEHKLDCRAMAERAKDVDIVSVTGAQGRTNSSTTLTHKISFHVPLK